MRTDIYLRLLLLALLATAGSKLAAQNDFEGKITFKIKYIKVPDMMKGYETMLPSETITYVKGGSARVEVEMAMGGSQIVIYNKETHAALMLMDMMGEKMAIPIPTEVLKEQEDLISPEIRYFEEFKTVSGYKCQKAVIRSKQEDGTTTSTTVYFTDKIKNTNKNFTGLKGLPLEYTTNQNGVESVFTAISVSAQSVPDSYVSLQIPDGYEETSLEELEGN